eukprot:69740-Chlamydomonas_euryale.AAC.3
MGGSVRVHVRYEGAFDPPSAPPTHAHTHLVGRCRTPLGVPNSPPPFTLLAALPHTLLGALLGAAVRWARGRVGCCCCPAAGELSTSAPAFQRSRSSIVSSRPRPGGWTAVERRLGNGSAAIGGEGQVWAVAWRGLALAQPACEAGRAPPNSAPPNIHTSCFQSTAM